MALQNQGGGQPQFIPCAKALDSAENMAKHFGQCSDCRDKYFTLLEAAKNSKMPLDTIVALITSASAKYQQGKQPAAPAQQPVPPPDANAASGDTQTTQPAGKTDFLGNIFNAISGNK